MLKTIVCIKPAYSQEVANGLQKYFNVYGKIAEIRAITPSFQNIISFVDTEESGGKDFLFVLSELDDGTDIVEQASFLRRQLFNCYIIFISENKNLLESLTNHSTMISGFYEYPFIDESFQNGLDGVFISLYAREQKSLRSKFAIDIKDPKTNTRKVIYKDMNEILYIEAVLKKIRYVTSSLVYSKDKSTHKREYEEFSNRNSLSDIEKLLDDKMFCRCHNSYIVNVRGIREYIPEESRLIMANGDIVIVSRSKKKNIEELLQLNDMKVKSKNKKNK